MVKSKDYHTEKSMNIGDKMNIGINQFINETSESRQQVHLQQGFQTPAPMLAENGNKLALQRSDMVAETKWDGTRVMLVKKGNIVRFFTVRGKARNEHTHRYPDLVADGKKLNCESCILDGEFVFFDKRGNDAFLTIQAKSETQIGKKHKYMAFDILEKDGQNLRDLELLKRRKILDMVIPNSLTIIKEIEVVKANKDKFFAKSIRQGREGVMLKTSNSRYVAGRSNEWLKVKRKNTIDVIAKGGTIGTGARLPYFGAVHCYFPVKGRMTLIGDVGSGFTDADLRRLTPIIRANKPFVIEVSFMQMTADFKMRFPVFVRVRDDKTPREVMRDGYNPEG